MHRDQARGLRTAVSAYILWGLLTIYWKQLAGFDAIEMIGWRIATASLFMGLFVTLTGRWAPIVATFRDRTAILRVLLASVLLTINWTTYVWAVVNERVIETALGYFLAPVGTIALGVLLLGERLTPLLRTSTALALVAVTVLTISYGRVPFVAIALAGTWSWYGLTKRRVALGPVESLTTELLVVFLPAVVLVIARSPRAGGVASVADGIDWLLLGGTGLITAVPLLLFAHAAHRVPFTILGPAQYLVPSINFLLGWLAFGESLPASRLVGFGLVWVALTLVTIDTVRRSNRDREPALVS
ncbi:MAG: EamA family transporter RarD [Ilumatobacteraceae bacterium]